MNALSVFTDSNWSLTYLPDSKSDKNKKEHGISLPPVFCASSEVPDSTAHCKLWWCLCSQHVLPRLPGCVLPSALSGLVQRRACQSVWQARGCFPAGNDCVFVCTCFSFFFLFSFPLRYVNVFFFTSVSSVLSYVKVVATGILYRYTTCYYRSSTNS